MKARQVLAVVMRIGWTELRQTGSHKTLERHGVKATWAFHDGDEIGPAMMARLARVYGFTPDDL